jgi:hypothetical protein
LLVAVEPPLTVTAEAEDPLAFKALPTDTDVMLVSDVRKSSMNRNPSAGFPAYAETQHSKRPVKIVFGIFHLFGSTSEL